jgi:Mu transposase, C-terminal domain
VAVKTTRQALVGFARNRYSVPSRYAGERLVLRAFPWHIELSDGQTFAARHPDQDQQYYGCRVGAVVSFCQAGSGTRVG